MGETEAEGEGADKIKNLTETISKTCSNRVSNMLSVFRFTVRYTEVSYSRFTSAAFFSANFPYYKYICVV